VAEPADHAVPHDSRDVELLGHVETVGPALDVTVSGAYAYVADGDVGLQVVDVAAVSDLTGPALPRAKPSRPRPPGLGVGYDARRGAGPPREPPPGKGVRARRLAVEDDLLYLVGWGALQIVDISDPRAPRALGALPMEGLAPLDVAVAGGYAYVAQGTGGVRIVDVSDPAAPAAVAAFAPEDAFIAGLAVGDGYLYAAASGAGLRIVDVSDPHHPVEEASHPTPLPAWDVELVGRRAFVVWNLRGAGGGPPRACASGVTVVDVHSPAVPEELGRTCDPSGQGVSDVAVDGQILYAAAGERGIRVLDVSHPRAPVDVGFYDTPGDALRVAPHDGQAYAADGEGGLFILRFTPDGFPANGDESLRGGSSRSHEFDTWYGKPVETGSAVRTWGPSAFRRTSWCQLTVSTVGLGGRTKRASAASARGTTISILSAAL
jgi:hypothetical protein